MRLAALLLLPFVTAMLGCGAGADLGATSDGKPKATADAKSDGTLVPVREAETLAPDEIGIKKYVFETKVPYGKVMVLRATEEREGSTSVMETIEHTNGGVARQVVLVYDWFSFPFSDGKERKVRVRFGGGEAMFDHRRLGGWGQGPGVVTLQFTNEAGDKDELTFRCFVEDYETTKKRVPDLPALSREAWTFGAIDPGK